MNATRKKICYVLPRYDVADHTHFAHIHDFIKELAKSAEIFLLVEKSKLDTKEISEALGIKVEVLSGNGRTPNILKNFFALLGARLTGWRDFYVHYSFLSAFNASLITKFLGGRVFYWNCGLPWKYRRSFLREQIEKLVYRLIDFLVTGTPSLARQYAENYHLELRKIKVMPNWISLEKFEPPPMVALDNLKRRLNISPADKILLFLHRLSKRKGVHLLPQIFSGVRTPNVKLLIIGDGPKRQFLERELLEEIAAGKVKLLGWVSHSEVSKYYAIADIFLLPSEEEGFPRVILEAMVVGLPFVAFDVGGIREIIPPNWQRNLVPAGQVEKFISQINELLMLDEEQRNVWEKEAAEWVLNFRTEKIAKTFLDLFN